MVGLGLSRVPDDEVGTERRGGFASADVGDSLEESLTVTPTTHPAQQRCRHMLQRKIEIRDAGCADGVNERVGQIRRIEIEKSDSINELRHLLDQRNDGSLPHPLIASECGEILGNQHDLASFELFDLGEDVADRSRALLAPK
ncbi:unannotated protein [freshwater metagenome]|uniref:Unannotated protein n=1 Tax=freshwater metagenome TaxID=449393 RepID=A0A6J5YI49_9ZZZZ